MAIELKNVSKSFGGVKALSGVSVSFGGGKIYGLLGSNGAGKTTMLNIIEYVLDRMRENTTYVRNIKKYLLAALYNAPATIDSYYTSLVSHDMYGSGERR